MKRPRLLDLFCCAGGAGVGYHRAGFDVVGVDIRPQPRYPLAFVQADALEYAAAHGHEFDAIHASPPCQLYSAMTRSRWADREHPDLVDATRVLLRKIGRPYVIENVPGAPLINPILLCGTMFGLRTAYGNQLRRHRMFEVWPATLCLAPECQHNNLPSIGVYGGGQHPQRRTEGARFGVTERARAMGIHWMTGVELNQAIPPAYTEYLGRQLMQALERRAA